MIDNYGCCRQDEQDVRTLAGSEVGLLTDLLPASLGTAHAWGDMSATQVWTSSNKSQLLSWYRLLPCQRQRLCMQSSLATLMRSIVVCAVGRVASPSRDSFAAQIDECQLETETRRSQLQGISHAYPEP